MAGVAAAVALACVHSLSTPMLAISDFDVRCTCGGIEQRFGGDGDDRFWVLERLAAFGSR